MGLKLSHIENHKQTAENALAARQAHLRAKGLDDRALDRDPSVKKIKAAIRKANVRMERVAAIDKQSVAAQAKRAGAKSNEEAESQEAGKKKKKKKKAKKEK